MATSVRQGYAKNRKLVLTALFSALVVVLAFTPFIGYIPLGVTKATTVHIPVIIGSILLGPKCGAILGGVFGLTSFITNSAVSPTITSFVFSPLYANPATGSGDWRALLICFIPRILVGVVPYFVYKLVMRIARGKAVGKPIGLVLAGVLGSMTNTVLVMSGIYFIFGADYAAAREIAENTLFGVILGIVGLNGGLEAAVAGVLSAIIAGTLMKLNVLKERA